MAKTATLDVTSWDKLPVTLDMPQVAEILGIGRRQAYELAHLRDFPARRFGRRVFVSKEALRNWLEQPKKE